ncbi:MAG TPA: hypothetical protein VGC73_02910, partial [Pyrinomonadaceae bacterium]
FGWRPQYGLRCLSFLATKGTKRAGPQKAQRRVGPRKAQKEQDHKRHKNENDFLKIAFVPFVILCLL